MSSLESNMQNYKGFKVQIIARDNIGFKVYVLARE